MLSSDEQNRIYQQAYVPEHIPDYVAAISGSEPYLFQDYLCFFPQRTISFLSDILWQIILLRSRGYIRPPVNGFNPIP